MSFQNFILNAYRMKRMLRQGWIDKVIGRKESIAEHSYNTTILAFLIVTMENDILKSNNRDLIDVSEVLLHALFHDFFEAKTFDIDHTLDRLLGKTRAKEIKQEIEKSSIKKITKDAQNLPFDFNQMLRHSDPRVTEIIKLADKLELIGQTKEYMKYGQLNSEIGLRFITNAKKYITENITQLKSLDRILLNFY